MEGGQIVGSVVITPYTDDFVATEGPDAHHLTPKWATRRFGAATSADHLHNGVCLADELDRLELFVLQMLAQSIEPATHLSRAAVHACPGQNVRRAEDV